MNDGMRTDATLALVTLAAFVAVALVVEAPFSSVLFLLGGVGTILFELLSLRYRRAIRRCWEQPRVQATAIVLALASIIVGAFVAPGPLLSAGIGALTVYVLLLGIVVIRRVSAGATREK